MDKRKKKVCCDSLAWESNKFGYFNPDQMDHCFWKKTFGEGEQMFYHFGKLPPKGEVQPNHYLLPSMLSVKSGEVS